MAKKQLKEKPKYHCRDCKHSYDPHEIGANGKPFMCRCRFSKFSKFLDRDHCDKFEMKY